MNNHRKLIFDVFLTEKTVAYITEVQFTEEMIQENQVVALIADDNDLEIEKKKLQAENVFTMISRKMSANGFTITDKVYMDKEEIVESLFKKFVLGNP